MSKNLNLVKTRFRLKPKCAGYNQCVSENKHKKYLQIFLKIKLLHINFDLRIIFGWSGYVYKHTQKLMKVARKSAISDVVAAKHKKALRAKAKVVNHCRYQVEAVQKKNYARVVRVRQFQFNHLTSRFIKSAKVSVSNAFAYFSILQLAYTTLMCVA